MDWNGRKYEQGLNHTQIAFSSLLCYIEAELAADYTNIIYLIDRLAIDTLKTILN